MSKGSSNGATTTLNLVFVDGLRLRATLPSEVDVAVGAVLPVTVFVDDTEEVETGNVEGAVGLLLAAGAGTAAWEADAVVNVTAAAVDEDVVLLALVRGRGKDGMLFIYSALSLTTESLLRFKGKLISPTGSSIRKFSP